MCIQRDPAGVRALCMEMAPNPGAAYPSCRDQQAVFLGFIRDLEEEDEFMQWRLHDFQLWETFQGGLRAHWEG